MLKEKRKDKKRKLYHFCDLIDDFDYTDYRAFKMEIVGGAIMSGYIYCLDRPDLALLQAVKNHYDNTEIIKTRSVYAPEIKKVWLFIAA